jgi:hypothetical protein
MSEEFLRLAPYLKDPFVLIGFFLLIAFSFSRILVKRVIPPLPKTLGFRILRLILLYGFIIGLVIIIFGFLLKRQELIGQQDAYFASYWALSDVATAWYIRGQVLERQRNCAEAKEAYKTIIAKYDCACIWDQRGWFWNVAKGAEHALKDLDQNGCTGMVR